MNKKFKFVLDNIKRFNDNTAKYLNKRYLYAWTSEIYCLLRFGASPFDYFRYRFYEKSNLERDKFITHRRSTKIINKYNDKEKLKIFYDKVTFNKYFKDFINREWLDLNTASQEEFENFLKKHKNVIMKPSNGGQGKGIFKLTFNENEQIEKVDNYRNYIVEEFLVQHKDMARLNPSSVNTMRVLTFKGKMIACTLKTGGAGAIVDNLKSNGVCAHVDTETGIVDAMGMDLNFNKYVEHPDSKVQFLGFKIPNWEQLKDYLNEVTKIVPEVMYVGWDIAFLEDGFAIIEGNHDPGHGIVQMIGQTGVYASIKAINKKR